MNKNTMLDDDDYEPVIINEQEENDTVEITPNINNEEIHEIFPYDVNQSEIDSIWNQNSIRCLISCWSKLMKQFKNYSEETKNTFWQLVSEHMVEQEFYFDAVSCEVKWTDLIKHYRHNKILMKNMNKTEPLVVWSHYFEMDRAVKGIPLVIIGDNNEDDDGLKYGNCSTTVSHTNNNASITNDDKCHWTVDATMELIRLYGKNRNKFLAVNQGGKHLLWEEISQQLLHLGHQYSANVCNDKWRNLKMTYKTNKQRELKQGIQQVKWFYFKDMDNIFSSHMSEEVKYEESSDVITVSFSESNEFKNVKKEENNDEDIQVFNENTVENIDGEGNYGNLETWTETATKSLIELFGIFRPRFLMAPQGKKRLLWNEISEQLRQKGYSYSGLVCDRKWRLLKANYLKRKEKYKKLGVNSVKWQYYHDIDRLLGVPMENISWSMDSTMCLIDAFDNHKDKFMKAATGEKHLIWKQISEELAQNNFRFSPRACDNKWRTLKNRYNKNRMRFNRNKAVVWVYYEKIDRVLRAFNKEKNPRNDEASGSYVNNQLNEDVELDEHNYIKSSKGNGSIKKEDILELVEMFKLRNIEFDKRLKKIENDLNSNEKMFQDIQQQTLDALKRSNDLEVRKLKLLEQLNSKFSPI